MKRRTYAAILLLGMLLASGCAGQTETADMQEDEVLSFEVGAHSASTYSSAHFPFASPAPESTIVPKFSEDQTLGATAAPPVPMSAPAVSATPGPTAAAAAPAATQKPSPEPTPAYRLTKVNNEKGHVKGHDVNLRQGPGTEYEVIKQIDYLSTVVITGKTDAWYRVKLGEATGFILKEFISLGAEPTPVPTPTPKPKPKATATPKTSSSQTSVKQGEKGDYSENDLYLAAKLIYAEGNSQSTESFRAMANVLYNRCKSKKFGGTVEKEVYRSGQFSVVKKSSFEGMKPNSKALKAAEEVFNEGVRVLPEGVMYFRAARLGTSWGSSREFYKTIGGNNYYY